MNNFTTEYDLLGNWQSNQPTTEDNFVLNFSPDGQLEITSTSSESVSVILLTYRVEGDKIITNQLSHPAEVVSGFSIDDDGILTIEFDGTKFKFMRAP